MRRIGRLVTRAHARLEGIEWLAQLVARIAVGLEFFGSGLGKLGKLSELIGYFRSLGIPAAEYQAPFVAGVELVCGAFLILGLVTRPAALMLCGVMIVAIVTAIVPEHHIEVSWPGLLEFLYLPEWLLLLLLGWLVLAGPGRVSLDVVLTERMGAPGDEGSGGSS